jgi:hypothetical protein
MQDACVLIGLSWHRISSNHCSLDPLNGAVPFPGDLGGIPHALACFQ